MDDKTRMRRINELNRDIERTRKHLQRCKQRNNQKAISTPFFIAALIGILAFVLAMSDVNAQPLGGWDTFPGPVAEPVDCRPTRKTRCA
jgi:hypothetical protein